MMRKIYGSLLIIGLMGWISCSRSEKNVDRIFQQRGWNFSCPFLTSDSQGHILLTWAGMDSTGRHSQIWIARFNRQTLQLQDVAPVPHTEGVYPHGENLPKLACASNGVWILAFGTPAHHSSNPYAGEVKYVVSTDAGKHWSEAHPLVNDTTSHDQRYFSLIPFSDNRFFIIWMDDRLKTKAEGSTLYFAELSPAKGILYEKPIAYQLCPCCRTAMLYDSTKHALHIAFRQIIHDSIRDIMHMVSFDQGQTFQEPQRVSFDNWVVDACPHSGPSLADYGGNLHIVWYTLGGGRGIFYARTTDDKLFTYKQQVSDFNMSAKHAQIAALPDGRLVIAWDEYPLHSTTAHQRIGLQLRDTDGKWVKTWYIADTTGDLQFPVLLPVSRHQLFIAYTRQQGRHSAVICRTWDLR